MRNKNTDVFEKYPVPKALAVLAFPMIIGQLIILAYNLADTFFIGRTNNPLMVAGISLILPVFNITISIASLFGIGGGTLISRLLGSGESENAGKVSSFSFYAAIISAGLFALFMYIFMDPVLIALGASNDTLIYARQYTNCVIVIGAVPTILTMTLANFLRSTGFAKQAGFGVATAGILNIFLDPLFMFVILPPGNEAVGAGIATMLSNVCAFLYFMITILKLGRASSLSLSIFSCKPSLNYVKQIIFVGFPAALSVFLFDVTYMVIDKLTANYGDVALAAVGIVLKTERLPIAVGIGLCQGMMPLAAYNYSSGNHARMKEVVSYSRYIGIIVSMISVTLYELLAFYIMRIFIADPETVRLGTNFLRVRCVATPFMFLCFHPLNFFQAVGYGGKALYLGVLRFAVFNIPMLYIFEYLFGLYGIVWTQASADIIVASISYYEYHKFKRALLQ